MKKLSAASFTDEEDLNYREFAEKTGLHNFEDVSVHFRSSITVVFSTLEEWRSSKGTNEPMSEKVFQKRMRKAREDFERETDLLDIMFQSDAGNLSPAL